MGERKAAVFCVGNRLMLDEGVGPVVYDTVLRDYEVLVMCDFSMSVA